MCCLCESIPSIWWGTVSFLDRSVSPVCFPPHTPPALVLEPEVVVEIAVLECWTVVQVVIVRHKRLDGSSCLEEGRARSLIPLTLSWPCMVPDVDATASSSVEAVAGSWHPTRPDLRPWIGHFLLVDPCNPSFALLLSSMPPQRPPCLASSGRCVSATDFSEWRKCSSRRLRERKF